MKSLRLLSMVPLLIGCASTGGGKIATESLPEFPPYTPTGNEPKVAVFDFENVSFST